MNYFVRVINLMEDGCFCRRITRYYSCSCLFYSLVKIIFPLKEHICLNKVRDFLEMDNIQFYFLNDKVKSAAVVCHSCMVDLFGLATTREVIIKNPIHFIIQLQSVVI